MLIRYLSGCPRDSSGCGAARKGSDFSRCENHCCYTSKGFITRLTSTHSSIEKVGNVSGGENKYRNTVVVFFLVILSI